MTNTPVDGVVEMKIGGVWVDVTKDIRQGSADSGGGVDISRGVPDEGARAEPTSVGFTLNNGVSKVAATAGQSAVYSPRNPIGPYFGKLGRNTPVRVGVNRAIDDFESRSVSNGWGTRSDGKGSWTTLGTASKFAVGGGLGTITTATGNVYATTGNYGNCDIRFRFGISTRVTGAQVGAVARMNNNNSWFAVYLDVGAVTDRFRIQRAGPAFVGGNNVNLGSNLIAGAIYEVVARFDGNQVRGKIYFASDPEPDNWNISVYHESQCYTDTIGMPFEYGSAGLWAANGGATIFTFHQVQIDSWRAHAEIAKLPPRWDLSRQDHWVPMQAKGLLRRYGQGKKDLESAVTRHLRTYIDNCVMWYRLEDEEDTTLAGSSVPGGISGQLTKVSFGSDSNLPGTSAQAEFGEDGSRLVGTANSYSGTGIWTHLMFVRVPNTVASEVRIVTIRSGGTARTWRISLVSTATYVVDCLDASGAILDTVTGLFYFLPEHPQGSWIALTLYLYNSGPNFKWVMNFHKPGNTIFYTTGERTVAGVAGNYLGCIIGTTSAAVTAGGLFVSQVAAYNIDLPFVTADFASAAEAYAGERAGDRFARLGDETNTPYRTLGQRGLSAVMGPQLPGKLLDLWEECALADGGFLLEGRVDLAITLRLGYTMYNQRPLPLSIDSGHLSPPLEPNDDDQLTRNDVVVKRPGGSSARSVRLTGTLNVSDPDDDPVHGVGTYDTAVERNVYGDSQLQAIADKMVGAGTLDLPRYPAMHADLTAATYQASPNDTSFALYLDSGDQAILTNPEVMADPAEQQIRGYTESIDEWDWDIEWNGIPGDVERVGILGLTTRVDTEYSTVSVLSDGFQTGTGTTLRVTRTATSKALWITTADFPTHFPFDIIVAGARLTVTAVSGTVAPQTFTVTATPVNGVIKTLHTGDEVHLYAPWRLAR
jgi:hypothetical protein